LLPVHQKRVAQEPATKSADQCVPIIGAVEHRGHCAGGCQPGDNLQEARGSLFHVCDGLRLAMRLHLHALLSLASRQTTARSYLLGGFFIIQHWIFS